MPRESLPRKHEEPVQFHRFGLNLILADGRVSAFRYLRIKVMASRFSLVAFETVQSEGIRCPACSSGEAFSL
jgi:hypothetical protein